MWEEDVSRIVIDNGSGLIKAGLSSDENPRSIFPSVIGRLKYRGYRGHDIFIGDEAIAKSAILLNSCPISIESPNWDDIESIWKHTFIKEIYVDPTEHPVLLTGILNNSRRNLSRMASIMFDTFNVPSLYFANQTLLSTYASGRTTACTVSCGEEITEVACIYEGFIIRHSIRQSKVAGKEVANYLKTKLYHRDTFFGDKILQDTYYAYKIVKEIKEKLCYVALDYNEEELKNEDKIKVIYTLPDDSEITLDRERFEVPELLFNPSLNYLKCDGIVKLIIDSIKSCDEDIQEELYNNIVLSGGTTLFRGFPERIEKEIKNKVPDYMNVKVIAREEREYGAWYGGFLLASLASFPQKVFTKEDYDENGIKMAKYFLDS